MKFNVLVAIFFTISSIPAFADVTCVATLNHLDGSAEVLRPLTKGQKDSFGIQYYKAIIENVTFDVQEGARVPGLAGVITVDATDGTRAVISGDLKVGERTNLTYTTTKLGQANISCNY